MQTILHRAGPFDIERIACPFYAGGVNLVGPRTGVLHTTEGGFEGSLAIFKKHYAPHFLISSSIIAQLVPIGMAGASLKAHNNVAIVQIEVVGFSKTDPWFPDIDTTNRLAAVMATMYHMFNVPLRRFWADGDFGRAGDNPHRHSGIFGSVPGWFAHGDVPAPDTHWDVGNLEWAKLFEAAKRYEPRLVDDTNFDTGHE